jgi:integrase
VFREIKERRRKTIRLAPELVAALRVQHAEQEAERTVAGSTWEDHGLVFCQPNGRPLDYSADWQEWSDILTGAGIPHAGTHAMRHSAATIAIHQGIALPVVQEMLGHSDIRVTRSYVDVSSPLAADAAARMGRALFSQN